ncbi:MAG: MaoC family dehydratase [Pseudomonadota bacterium]
MSASQTNQPTFFELLEPGMVQELGSYTFERDEIIEFAAQFDPQRFHLSEEAAQASNFGALCASGWHTVSVWMRMNVLNGRPELKRMTGYTGEMPQFGPSPGVRNVKWLAPVFVGDTITFRSTITSKRITPHREGWGMALSHSEGSNQHGTKVFQMDGAVTLRID